MAGQIKKRGKLRYIHDIYDSTKLVLFSPLKTIKDNLENIRKYRIIKEQFNKKTSSHNMKQIDKSILNEIKQNNNINTNIHLILYQIEGLKQHHLDIFNFIITLLTRHKSDTNSYKRDTFLIFCIKNRLLKTCEYIIKNIDRNGNAYLNTRGKDGYTALQTAILYDDLTLNKFGKHVYIYYEIIKTILEHGADPNIKNNDGETALLIAIKYAHEHIYTYKTDEKSLLLGDRKKENVLNLLLDYKNELQNKKVKIDFDQKENIDQTELITYYINKCTYYNFANKEIITNYKDDIDSLGDIILYEPNINILKIDDLYIHDKQDKYTGNTVCQYTIIYFYQLLGYQPDNFNKNEYLDNTGNSKYIIKRNTDNSIFKDNNDKPQINFIITNQNESKYAEYMTNRHIDVAKKMGMKPIEQDNMIYRFLYILRLFAGAKRCNYYLKNNKNVTAMDIIAYDIFFYGWLFNKPNILKTKKINKYAKQQVPILGQKTIMPNNISLGGGTVNNISLGRGTNNDILHNSKMINKNDIIFKQKYEKYKQKYQFLKTL
jgi:ankyrin repeat protein